MLAGSAVRSSKAEETPQQRAGKDNRSKWLEIVERVSQPVLEAISRQKLRAAMPVEAVKGLTEASAQIHASRSRRPPGCPSGLRQPMSPGALPQSRGPLRWHGAA